MHTSVAGNAIDVRMDGLDPDDDDTPDWRLKDMAYGQQTIHCKRTHLAHR